MIFTLTDRHYNVLDAYETDDYLIGQYIGSILETLEINILVKSLNAEHWVEGNYIMCQDKRGKKRWFTIYDCDDSHGGDVKSLFCYSGTIDIVAEDAAPISAPDPKPFKWYFDQIFYDTGIELGINEISDLTRKLEFTSENASNAEMLQYVLNGFDNAEASLDVEFDGATPTKLVLNVYKRIGNEEPQAILSDEDDSLTSLERKGSISDLATCINPTGAEDENGNPITLLGKYYEEKDENGNILYYSPVDSPRVFSVVARRDFYVQLPGKANGEFDGYINRRYESQATTQDTLWQESLAQLKKIDHVAVTYEANGYIDCSIGDNVQIVSHEMKPPVMIAARTIEYKFNDDDPSRNVYKFGNYVELTSNLDDLAKIIAEVKKQVEPQVIEAERNAKVYAETISAEKAAQAESNAKGYTDTVKVQVVEHANTVANQAENNAKSHADTVAGEAESNAKAYALSEADKARIAAIQAAATDAQTKVNAAKTALEASIAEKADAEWVNGQLQLKADNTTVQDLQNEVTQKADVTWVNNQLVLKENAIHRGTTAPTDTTKLWLDTSVVPNVLKRYDSATSSWVKATPTSAGEVGAYTKTEVENALNSKVSVTTYTADKNGIISRLDSAESRITQNEQEIATKVSQTDYDALEGRVSQAESSIVQNANAIQSKVSQTAFNALDGRVSTAESTITQHANLIEQKVNRTDYDTDMNGVVTRLNSAESRITQNENEIATKVSNTTYQQDKTTINNNISQLTTRMGQAETELQQTSSQIALKANKTDVYTKTETDNKFTSVNQQISQLDAELSVQADQIATKVSRTEFESLQVGGRNLITGSDFGGNPFKYEHTNKSGEGGLRISENLSITQPLKQGEKYTISMRVRGSATIVLYRISASGNSAISWLKPSDLSTTEYKQVKLTFEPHTLELTDIYIYTAYRTTAYTEWFEIEPNSLKLERGNIATDWTPAPEDVQGQIDGLGTRVSSAESTITQQADLISQKVSKTDYNGNTIASLINQTATTIKLQASKINLVGAVTVLSDITGNLGDITAGNISGVNITGSTLTAIGSNNASVTIDENGWYVKDETGKVKLCVTTKETDFAVRQPSAIQFFTLSGSRAGYVGMYENQDIMSLYSGTRLYITAPRLEMSANDFYISGEARFYTTTYTDPEPNVMKAIKVSGGIATDGLYANAGTISKTAISTNGKIYVGGEGIEMVWPGGTPYIDFVRMGGYDYNARIIAQTDSLAFLFNDSSIVRHKFNADGTKSGGSIEIDGKNLGMSPIDSPQVLLETIEFDVPLTEQGTKVLLDSRFAKAVNYRFAVYPNRGEVIEKGADYFVIAGEGLADIRIVGERVGYAGVYFDDMTMEGVV